MKFLKFVLLIICVSLFWGCGKTGDDLSGFIRVRIKEDPTTLDPAYIVDVTGGMISAKLYNGLIRIDENARIKPDIAQSWKVSEDGLSYTFVLRNGVKFSDGKGITASDFLKCYSRIISPDVTSPREWIFDKVKEFKVISPTEFQIVLKEQFAPFIYLLTMPNAYLVSDNNLGTGPYILYEWLHDNKLLLTPNPYYYDVAPKIKGIMYKVIPEDFTARTEFELGNLDVMGVSLQDWKYYKQSDKWKMYSCTGLNTYYIGFNLNNPVFRSRRTRQAFNYAIDKEKIIEYLLGGQAEVSGGAVPSVLLDKNIEGYSYLPNKAKKLLAQSGVKFDKPLNIYVRAQKESIRIVESIQHYFTEVGIETKIVPLEWSAYKEAINEGEADLFLMSWWADYPSAENFLFPTFHSSNWGSGGNRAFFKNDVIDRLIIQSQKESDDKKRILLYGKLNRLIAVQAPWAFLWNKRQLVVTQEWVDGYKIYPVYNGDKGTDIQLRKEEWKKK